MASICVQYLPLKDFEGSISKDETRNWEDYLDEGVASDGGVASDEAVASEEEDEEEQRDPTRILMNYSAANWPEHFRKAEVDNKSVVFNLALTLIETKSSHYAVWFPEFWTSLEQDDENPRWTSLHLAAFCSHREVVRYLLDKTKMKVDSSEQDIFGRTALFRAIKRGHDAVIQLLLDKGANFNVFTHRKSPALQLASSEGDEKVVQLLLKNGANINALGEFYGSALQAASSNGHKKIKQLLLNKGADVNALGGHCGSALQAASAKGHKEIVQLLLSKGAYVNALDGGYGSALQAALLYCALRNSCKSLALASNCWRRGAKLR